MKAISSMATRHLLVELAEAALAAGLPEVSIESVGGVDAASRVASGEQVDLVFLASGAMDELASGEHIDDAARAPLVVSHVALAVPDESGQAAAAAPGASPSMEDFRAALLAARRIGYSTGPSGTALLDRIRAWGLEDELSGRLERARPGVPVAQLIARGDVDLGVQQVSELVGQPGVRLLGTLPPEAGFDARFDGAVAALATDPVPARRVLEFFASDSVAAIKSRLHFSVPSE